MFEIGNTLREARLRRALDIGDCESATKIRAKYLRALEEEQFEVLPGPTYVKGFLRTYAEYLELDGRLVLDEYESRFTGRQDQAYVPDGEAARRRANRRRNREGRVLLVASTLVLLVSTGVWVGFADSDDERPAQVSAAPLTVTFTTAGRRPTYLEVRQDNEAGASLVTPGPLPSGESKTIAERPPIWVRVGTGSGIRLVVNDQPVETPAGEAEYTVTAGGTIEPSTEP